MKKIIVEIEEGCSEAHIVIKNGKAEVLGKKPSLPTEESREDEDAIEEYLSLEENRHVQVGEISLGLGEFIQMILKNMVSNSNPPHNSKIIIDDVTYGSCCLATDGAVFLRPKRGEVFITNEEAEKLINGIFAGASFVRHSHINDFLALREIIWTIYKSGRLPGSVVARDEWSYVSITFSFHDVCIQTDYISIVLDSAPLENRYRKDLSCSTKYYVAIMLYCAAKGIHPSKILEEARK